MSSAIALLCRAARAVMIESHRFCIARMPAGVWWSCAALVMRRLMGAAIRRYSPSHPSSATSAAPASAAGAACPASPAHGRGGGGDACDAREGQALVAVLVDSTGGLRQFWVG
jgi:hypothetical protein